jgi:acetyl-CoA C-acetyltransferase
MTNPNTPVLVGVAQLLHRAPGPEQALEPVELMLRASRLAEADTGATGVLEQVQSVRVIRGIWGYENPARYVAERIGAPGAQTVGTLFGGNQNQAVVNRTALSILSGELELVLITGAEYGYSSSKARKAGVEIPLTKTPGQYDLVIGAQKPEHHDNEIARGIRTPIQAYSIYENAIRHSRGETQEAHLGRVSELWSRFNDVAQTNPHAWIRENVTAEEIRTPSATNRLVAFPYTKLMSANMAVDMGAALILCSLRKARQLGIPERLWVYPQAGVEGYDHFSASVRYDFHSSPAIRLVGSRLLERTQTNVGDLAFVDLYSCFPSAVQIAARELGLRETDPLTVTGGLTFGGGPLNNYVMHSIARMVTLLREHPGERGLITANGGNLYKHAHCIYSTEPPAQSFSLENVQAEIDALPARECLAAHQGEVTIESYTVMYAGAEPSVGHLACLTPGGERTWVNTHDAELMQALTHEEFCGRRASLDARGTLTIRS